MRDAVEAYLGLAEHLPGDGITGEAFNFGPQEPLSVLEVVQRVLHLMGRAELVPEILNLAVHEIPSQFLDCTKAAARLGWQPRYSFEDGLRETVAWYQAELER